MAKKKIKVVEANAKKSDTIHRLESFSNRFNLELGKNSYSQFHLRCLTAIAQYAYNETFLVRRMSIEISMLLGFSYTHTVFDNEYSNSQIKNVLEELKITDSASLHRWLMVLECIIAIEVQDEVKRTDFAMSIAEALILSGINSVLCDTADGYIFYPANAEYLDQKLVIDVLNWLSKYPDAKEQYDKALRLYVHGDRSRHVIDSLRLSFELFLKRYFTNKTSIENQKNEIGILLKNSDVSVEVRNMFIKLVDYFATYNNQHIKHGDSSKQIGDAEIEFIIYLTGSFMRFLIQILEESSKVT